MQALGQLSRQISVTVSSSVRNAGGNDNNVYYDTTRIVTEVSSNAVFFNTEMLMEQQGKKTVVLRYIHRDEIGRQRQARAAKIKEMVRVGNNALASSNVGDALRYYYWAYLLTGTLPPTMKVPIVDEEENERDARTWLNARIDVVMGGIKAELGSQLPDGNNDYEVHFSYKGKPVGRLDYTYWTGSGWSPLYSAVDGKGLLELRSGYNPSNLSLRYEYRYEGSAQSDPEIARLLKDGDNPSFNSSSTSIQAPKSPVLSSRATATPSSQASSTHTASSKKDTPQGVSSQEQQACQQAMERMMQSIRTHSRNVADLCTPYGQHLYDTLLHYGQGRIVGTPQLTFSKLGNEIRCKGLYMTFSFSGNRKFTEEVVFTFNKELKIDNISFGLGEVATNDLFGLVGAQFSDESRQILESFLENYKTAYALKRLDYIEQLFADDALIITGRMLTKAKGDVELGYQNNRYVELTQQDKATFIKNLRRSFASKEFINLQFANNRVRHTVSEGVYAIQIKQDYFSNNYGDSGYLMLLVDLRDPKSPIIHVRVWQEAPDPKWGIIGPGMF